jgi:hypothetical protein
MNFSFPKQVGCLSNVNEDIMKVAKLIVIKVQIKGNNLKRIHLLTLNGLCIKSD